MVAAAGQQIFAAHDKQCVFLDSPAWCRGFVAGRGCGKTKVGAADIIHRAKNGESYMGVSPSYPAFIDTTWPVFRETCEELGVWIRGVHSPIPRATFRTQDGGKAEITFRTAENPESLRGPSKAGLWLDEASVMHEDVFKWAIPVLRHKGKMGRLTMTFTPKGRQHWTFKVFYVQLTESERFEVPREDQIEICGSFYKQRENHFLVSADTRDNPFLPPEFYSTIRGHYSESLAEQELGGLFVDMEGLLFRRMDFRFAEKLWTGEHIERVRYWDKAGTDEQDNPTAARSAGIRIAKNTKTNQYMVEDVVVGQWGPMKRNEIMLKVARQDAELYGNTVLIYCEQEGGSGGKESMDQTIRELAAYPVYRDIVSGKTLRTTQGVRLPGQAKVDRARPLAAQVEAGNIFLLRGAAWVDDYLDEVAAFPEYRWADQVDASSGAFNKLATHGLPSGHGGPERMPMPRADAAEQFGIQRVAPRRRERRRR